MPTKRSSSPIARLAAAGLAAVAAGALAHAAPAEAQLRAVPGVTPATIGTRIDPGGPQRRVTSALELEQVLNSDFKGRIVIPRDARWEMVNPCGTRTEFGDCAPTPMTALPVKSGVSIVGERGALGSRPLLFTRYKAEGYPLLKVTGNDVLIQGLHLRGPKPVSEHNTRTPYVHGIMVEEDADNRTGRRVLITDNEMEQWAGGAVYANGAYYAHAPKHFDHAQHKHLEPQDAGLVRVHANYFHHNAMNGGGYGVVVGSNAYAMVTGNVFDTHRHAVAASGQAYSGYVARHNYVLAGGVVQKNYYNQHFDVHGTGPDGIDGGTDYGGYAGEFFDVSSNTIRGEQSYFAGLKTRPAVMLRGRTAQGFHFNGNVLVHDDLDAAVSLKMDKSDTGFGEDQKAHNFHAAGNRFNTDYSTEIAKGDFDGDGRDDVFVANGTGWFYSKAGIRHWEYLRASNRIVPELGFADIDNDRVTDVLHRDAAGRLGYHRAGRSELTALTTVPVPMSALRFGDFDGDAKTDIFYTRNQQWHVWYGRTRRWTPTNSSVTPIGDMLFGEFDAVRGTDIVAVRNGAWSISSATTRPWAKLNRKLTSSFRGAIAADIEGDGRHDIVIAGSSKWTYSRNGTGKLETLRTGTSPRPLREMLVGRFDPTTRARIVTFGPGDRLLAWSGATSGNRFITRSTQSMR